MNIPTRRETWGEMGPAMRALRNDRWRTFVRTFVENPNPKAGGGKAAAHRAAGLGGGSTSEIQAKRAWDLAHDERIIGAIAEESRKIIRGGAPGAANELLDIMYDRSNGGRSRNPGGPMSDETPDPQKLLRLARQTMSSAERRRKYSRIDFLDTTFWYPTQLAFFAAGDSGVHQRLLFGGNQSGKTCAGASEVGGWHATGNYPEWWTGHRFKKPIRIWVTGESTTLVRDTLQRHLCGAPSGGGTVVRARRFGGKRWVRLSRWCSVDPIWKP